MSRREQDDIPSWVVQTLSVCSHLLSCVDKETRAKEVRSLSQDHPTKVRLKLTPPISLPNQVRLKRWRTLPRKAHNCVNGRCSQDKNIKAAQVGLDLTPVKIPKMVLRRVGQGLSMGAGSGGEATLGWDRDNR